VHANKKKSMYKTIYHGKQRILSDSDMFKTKNRELLVQRIFRVIQYVSQIDLRHL
jgi:hypothetical protein